MAYRRVFTRTGNSPYGNFPASAKTEVDRLKSEGILISREEVFVTSPAELSSQNISNDQFKSTVTEVWRSESDFNNWKTFVNNSSDIATYDSQNNITLTIVSGENI
jgi:hypothetical protein